jgi:hypothetical protein
MIIIVKIIKTLQKYRKFYVQSWQYFYIVDNYKKQIDNKVTGNLRCFTMAAFNSCILLTGTGG